MNSFSPAEWHERFRRQAGWTEPLRRYLLNRAALPPEAHILEVGCGTGAVLSSVNGYTQHPTWGLDIHLPYLRLARAASSDYPCINGDALRLPFASNRFDLVYCHFLLLWVTSPETVLAEMVRVIRPGGWVAAFAEPDYGGRVDFPAALETLGQRQSDALARQGANTRMGRRLAGLFNAAGLGDVETGVLGGQWTENASPGEIESEWQTLEHDLAGSIEPAQLTRLRQEYMQAWQSGQRVLFVPTFYAFGRK